MQIEVESMLEKQGVEETTPGGEVSSRHILSAQEGWQPEAGHKSKVSEQVRAHRALQDGGNAHLERAAKSSRLDGKSRPERCLLYANKVGIIHHAIFYCSEA